MNQNHIATMGAAGTSAAAVGILCWLLSLMGIQVPGEVEAYMVTLATAWGAYFFHRQTPPQNPTQGQG